MPTMMNENEKKLLATHELASRWGHTQLRYDGSRLTGGVLNLMTTTGLEMTEIRKLKEHGWRIGTYDFPFGLGLVRGPDVGVVVGYDAEGDRVLVDWFGPAACDRRHELRASLQGLRQLAITRGLLWGYPNRPTYQVSGDWFLDEDGDPVARSIRANDGSSQIYMLGTIYVALLEGEVKATRITPAMLVEVGAKLGLRMEPVAHDGPIMRVGQTWERMGRTITVIDDLQGVFVARADDGRRGLTNGPKKGDRLVHGPTDPETTKERRARELRTDLEERRGEGVTKEAFTKGYVAFYEHRRAEHPDDQALTRASACKFANGREAGPVTALDMGITSNTLPMVWAFAFGVEG